jgi:hypothetical protein
LTGIQRVAKEGIFSKLNNLSVYTVLDEAYARGFGLTTDETDVLPLPFPGIFFSKRGGALVFAEARNCQRITCAIWRMLWFDSS